MADPKWLEDLQTHTQGAVKEIAKLRKQNKSLKTQLDTAKEKLVAAEEAVAGTTPDPEAEAWRGERKEIRRRVARLSKTLEELL